MMQAQAMRNYQKISWRSQVEAAVQDCFSTRASVSSIVTGLATTPSSSSFNIAEVHLRALDHKGQEVAGLGRT